MTNADTLEDVCQDYFLLSPAPNLAGLCAHLGTTPIKLRNLFARAEDYYAKLDPAIPSPPNPSLPSPDAMTVLSSAVMHIEASIVEGGLVGRLNAHMSKFVLSAFHDRNEKQLHETKSDNIVTVRVESKDPVNLEELKEYQRLEAAIEEQTKLELTAMGRDRDTSTQEQTKLELTAMGRDNQMNDDHDDQHGNLLFSNKLDRSTPTPDRASYEPLPSDYDVPAHGSALNDTLSDDEMI